MFICDQCGECCRHLDKSNLYKELDRGDGICRYLEHNLCSIYDKRPLLCRVDEAYVNFFKKYIPKDEYLAMNYAGCQEIKKLKEDMK